MYNKYDKNHKERDQLDYYATPPDEVLNILNVYKPNFENKIVLDPCAGQGHMMTGILDYTLQNHITGCRVIGTDVQKRKPLLYDGKIIYETMGPEYDFLADDYPLGGAGIDWIVMNPPFKTIEPFMIRALEIAQKGVIMLARLQVLEGKTRYEEVFEEFPPNDIYVYIDRINCWKNGVPPTESSAQAYCWVIWNKDDSISCHYPRLHWIHRV